jgi:hypothetical protein
MVEQILTDSGIAYRKTRFLKPPSGTYAVYTDDMDTLGGDSLVAAYHHQITIELYEAGLDNEAEARIEDLISQAGIQWEKQDRFWLQAEQRYQVIYEFEYYTKLKRSV